MQQNEQTAIISAELNGCLNIAHQIANIFK